MTNDWGQMTKAWMRDGEEISQINDFLQEVRSARKPARSLHTAITLALVSASGLLAGLTVGSIIALIVG